MSSKQKVEEKHKLSKAQLARKKVLEALDAMDAEVEGKKLNGHGDFGKLFEESMGGSTVQPGEVVKARVVEIQQDFVVVDFNFKSEGLIRIHEFKNADGKVTVQVDDEIEVYIDRIENENGMAELSKDKADMIKAWSDISRAAENEENVEGVVLAKVKGGLSVDIGVKAFLPGSQIDIRPVRNLDIYVGKKYKFKVIKFNKKRGNIVLSRRAILEEERSTLRTQTIDSMREGAVANGIVKNITDYGAFIDLGGMDGLLHITDMSWGRVKHPSELLNVGDEIQVMVLKYDEEKERVSLGLKQLQQDPWQVVKEKYTPETKVKGKVVSLADYGAFIELNDGIEGLIHVSEMSWTKRIKHPSQLLKVGDEVEVIVLEVDTENRRISLGLKQLEPNPWIQLKKTYPTGTIIEGEVTSVTEFGVFISIEDGIDGLVHISDISWTKRVNHPSELYKKGDKVRAVVLGVDIENERFGLGIKQLDSDPWANIDKQFGVGTQHDVRITKVADFGVFVELAPEIEGLIHISELSKSRVEKTEDFAKVDDVLRAEVVTIDKDARRIGLSSKLVQLRSEKQNVDEYIQKAKSTSKTTMGDLFSETLNSVTKKTE